MPSFNNAIPPLPKSFDLRDVVDHIDRLLEVADQAVTQLQGQVFPLTVSPDGTDTSGGVPTGAGTAYAAGKFPRPGYVVSSAGVTAYENLLTQSTVAACMAANTGYGIKELAAVLKAKLSAIPSIT